MIIFTVYETKPDLFTDIDDMIALTEYVLNRSNFLDDYPIRDIKISEDKTKLDVVFEKVAAIDDETMFFLSRLVNKVFRRFTSTLGVSNVRSRLEENDAIIGHSTPENTENDKLLDRFNCNATGNDDAQIPEHYQCALSAQVMDNPVYIKGLPEMVYDRKMIEHDLFTKIRPLDPYRRINVNPITDIIPLPDLKKEINQYVRQKIEQKLEEKRDRFLRALANSRITDTAPQSIEKAFRRAAYDGRVEDMNILLSRISNINAQDNAETSDANNDGRREPKRRTALHWAVIQKHPEVVKLLLELNARSDIPDAMAKTAIDYAWASLNPAIKELLGIPTKEDIEAQEHIDTEFRKAAVDNDVNKLRALLPKISNINARDTIYSYRRTAMHGAVLKNSVDAIKWLLQHGAATNILDANGLTAIHYANPQIKSLLLPDDCDTLDSADEQGSSLSLR